MKKNLRAFFFIAMILATLQSFAEGREYIRNSIKEWGECKNVAITKTNGDVALYGKNGSSRSDCPTGLNQKLVELNENGNTIEDVCLTERGNWIILYDDNAFWWDGIPSAMETKLRQYNRNGEKVTSVTFNDLGEWIIVTEDHIAASSTSLQDWLFEGCDSYGALWSCCITEDGCVAVYESGYYYRGNVPDDFKTALREADIDVYRAKFAGTSWFYADRSGSYHYNM